jgi:hypothetical protein
VKGLVTALAPEANKTWARVSGRWNGPAQIWASERAVERSLRWVDVT